MAEPFTLRDYVASIMPPWLRRFFGERLVGATTGLMADAAAEASAQALQGAWLRSGFQPPDALPILGRERRIPRYPRDTDDTYRARLVAAWDDWMLAGNPLSVLGQLADYGLTTVYDVPAENSSWANQGIPSPADDYGRRWAWRFEEPASIRHTKTVQFISGSKILRLSSGSWAALGYVAPGKVLVRGASIAANNAYLHFDQVDAAAGAVGDLHVTDTIASEGPTANVLLDATNWSRFAIVIQQPHPFVPITCGWSLLSCGSSDESPTCGSSATQGDVKSIKAIIRKWRWGNEVNPRIWLVFTGNVAGQPGTVAGGGAPLAGGTAISWAHQS